MKRIIRVLIRAGIKAVDHDGVEHAGYMAFMVLLSIFPFIVFFLAFTSFVGASDLGRNFISMLSEHLPPNVIDTISPQIKIMLQSPPQSLLTLAILGTVWTSSSFVEGLRTILNRVHEVNSPPPYWFRRLLSIIQFLVMIVVIFFTTLVLVILPIGLNKIPQLGEFVGHLGIVWVSVRYLVLFITLILMVTSIYYFIPNTKLKFLETMPGACLTVALWSVIGNVLSQYISNYGQLNIIYGYLGHIIITLLFFYLCMMIFIYGAEFNRQLSIN